MAFAETDTKQSSGHTACNMSKVRRAGDCSECAAYFQPRALVRCLKMIVTVEGKRFD
jgi:hypothetical protein